MTVDSNIIKDVKDSPIQNEMEECYLAYAMNVIVARALPDVRDGMKPVHRRILYAMNEMGCQYNRAHKKSARVVGEVMGKYHPHGDAAIYDAMVRLAQDFSMGQTLVDGQGNFGSIDNDPPAAPRYTEVRLQQISHTMLSDLENDTVDFRDNYDGTEREPIVLPASFPNLLVNGGEGIAVGMATKIPPHNLGEILDACLAYIENKDITIDELVEIVPGPDFPTCGTILSSSAAKKALITGQCSIPVRGKTHFEEVKGGREAIIITEIPYQVIKSDMIMKIAELVKDKKIEGISGIRDESNRHGIRVVIDIKKDSSSEVVLNYLYKLTTLQTTYAVNMLAINKNRPEVMNLKSIISNFIEFREEIVTRRILHLLNQDRSRAHILIGFHVAVDSIDKVISIIRNSKDTNEARQKLISEKWPASSNVSYIIDLVCDKQNKVADGYFYFTDAQVKAILEMRLSRLTGIEKDNLLQEITKLGEMITYYLSVLKDHNLLMGIISNELIQIKKEFAVPRKTEIKDDLNINLNIEDFIDKKDVLISCTVNGYIKRTDLDSYTTQHRGGKGKQGMNTLDDDSVLSIYTANTHSDVLFFTISGKVFKIKAHKIPETAANARGRAFVNLINVEPGDKIATLLIVPEEINDQIGLIFAMKNGNIRRSSFKDFENVNSNGKIAISLDDGDSLIGVKTAHEDDNILLASKNGLATRFKMEKLRVIKSRNSSGVRGMNLSKNDALISLCILSNNENDADLKEQILNIPIELREKIKNDQIGDLEIQMELDKIEKEKCNLSLQNVKKFVKEEQMLMTITKNGFAKRTSAYEYRITGRSGKGIKNINITDKNGEVVETIIAESQDEVILIGNKGKTIKIPANSVRIVGRNSIGVKAVNLDSDEKISSVGCIHF